MMRVERTLLRVVVVKTFLIFFCQARQGRNFTCQYALCLARNQVVDLMRNLEAEGIAVRETEPKCLAIVIIGRILSFTARLVRP